MPIPLLLWSIALRVPRLFGGAVLHRAGLRALHAGDGELADRLFECAADRYREEIRVEPLARLRAHQLIAQARRDPNQDPELWLEVDRRLGRLDRIEGLEPPFDLVEAATLLATWQWGGAPAAEPLASRRAA